jgi:hypothetical protein
MSERTDILRRDECMIIFDGSSHRVLGKERFNILVPVGGKYSIRTEFQRKLTLEYENHLSG